MIAIFMNTREWGGVDILVARFAEFLRAKGQSFIIIDKEDAHLRTLLPWADIRTCAEVADLRCYADAMFFPSITKLRMPDIPWHIAKPDARTFTWIVNPNDACFSFIPMAARLISRFGYKVYPAVKLASLSHVRLVGRAFSDIARNGALAAMDGATSRSLNYFYNLDSQPSVLPIPAPLGDFCEVNTREEGAPVRFGYLGRLDAFKWSALKPFIAVDLAQISKTREVSLLAITAGPFVDELSELCARHNIKLEVTGFLPNDVARARLREGVDLAVAMGTAALDIASEKIPCVIIDPAVSPKTGPQVAYRFVHQTKDFTLGEFRDCPAYIQAGGTISDLLQVIRDDPSIGEKSREYVARRHSPECTFTDLLNRICESELTAAQLKSHTQSINNSFERRASLFGMRR